MITIKQPNNAIELACAFQPLVYGCFDGSAASDQAEVLLYVFLLVVGLFYVTICMWITWAQAYTRVEIASGLFTHEIVNQGHFQPSFPYFKYFTIGSQILTYIVSF